MANYEAFITAGWQALGVAQITIGRHRGKVVEYAGFVVDVWCLGVKDATSVPDLSRDEFAELVERTYPNGRESIDPNCARKLIDGAIAYAQRLGFAPHRDYRKARRVLSGLDGALCPTEFSFGCNGRPHYVQGAESAEVADRIIARLDALLGEDGYDFTLEEDDLDETDAVEADVLEARTNLADLLEAEPDEVPEFYTLSGMIIAALLAPAPTQPTRIMELVWGPQGRSWKSQKELQSFLDDLMRYWNFLAQQVMAACCDDADENDRWLLDIWDQDCPEGLSTDEFHVGCSIGWARGFVRVWDAWPEMWTPVRDRRELTEALAVIRAYAELPSKAAEDTAVSAAERGLSLEKAAFAFARAARPELR